MRRMPALLLIGLSALAAPAWGQTAKQPKVAPGPSEPDWDVVLKQKYGLSMFADLLNPVKTTVEATPGLFKKAGPGPVEYRPAIALGLVTLNRGGWYAPTKDDRAPEKHELWSYTWKNTTEDVETGKRLPPPLAAGSTTSFEPGEKPFGLWVSNDGLKDSLVFTQPRLVAANNPRLARQPYKVMIYPNRDLKSGKLIPHSYLIGWEYSTNDDFQDIVCTLDNVDLVDEGPASGTEK
ncbi:hypothetical protein Sinac_5070 [Singulisphaera acidiphila DSM 18658]|uniref:Uncharacterized protein n=2 Tax=Singulisphaera acidiphila TaxID=466153 RepID=L0DIY2_SINAD|nr:hypothetical protein Sinac_5070 [Singulisphaera acidiphila DSM 18658]